MFCFCINALISFTESVLNLPETGSKDDLTRSKIFHAIDTQCAMNNALSAADNDAIK